MRFLIMFIMLGVVVGFSVDAEAHSCQDLSKKVCKALGSATFHCRVFRSVANNANASQKSCQRYLNNWVSVKQGLSRKETLLQQMNDLAAKNGTQAQLQVNRYKKQLAQKTIRSMLKGNSLKSTNKQACLFLTKKVCGDLGHRSYYCRFFRLASKRRHLNIKRCQLMIDNWATMQKNYYIVQELRLRKMAKQAKSSTANKKKFIKAQKHEWIQLLKFLTQK